MNDGHLLEFERPVRELENQIEELGQASKGPHLDFSKEINGLKKKVAFLIKEIYGNLSPWERVQLSRHPQRPQYLDYIKELVPDFRQIHGDRKFADDQAIIAGIGTLMGKHKAVFVGIQKGRKTKDKIKHNFGMPRPEGYRKALRVFQLAERFSIPIVTFIDTPGAYPGIGAEERGQACAIAENLEAMFGIKSPIISIVIGEGGSGGALGLAVADQVLMMEYSVYSVISPESCASILWADPKKAQMAANELKLGPKKAVELGIVDRIIREPLGGAHRDNGAAIEKVGEELCKSLDQIRDKKVDQVLKKRYNKFRSMGNKAIGTMTEA